MTIALAAFVRTPGLSPAKTRLAAGIGVGPAAEFYRLAVGVTESLLSRAAGLGIVPYWAVAEEAGLGDGRWGRHRPIWQGTGGLGERQDYVYRQLLERHDAALLIGSDCPLLAPEDLERARDRLEHGVSLVLGPATDGGYYLVGGRVSIPTSLWLEVGYSAPDTAAKLAGALRALGAVGLLEPLPDVDTAEDLWTLPRHPRAGGTADPALRLLLEWIARLGCGGEAGLDESRKVDTLDP